MPHRQQEIFCAALERTDPAERAAYLDAACAGAAGTRARVEALLRAAEEAGGFLADAPGGEREAAGARIGRYLLREKIGEGGFGVVYRAEQDEPVRRTVALKIIKLGMDTRAVVARFEAERQALALMEHPHIARVFDGGATEAGRPFFVMELVRGVPITAYCREEQLGLRARLALFQQVCRAIHHAHQKGVIHRDLKPSNILVARDGERPVAKVIDFGIAKATREPLTAQTLVTRLHVLMGTPAYMSPEQVGLGDIDVDTRSDIYSLGALLYELLADEPVLDAPRLLAAGYAEVQRVIHHVEPAAPSARVAALEPARRQQAAAERRTTPARWAAELRGDLDRIVLKCLEKDRTRRYETTEDLARDIGRHLANEPVLARPATLRYRATKFCRRHRRSVLAAAAALAVLVLFALYHSRRLATERDRARIAAHNATKASELLTELLATADPFRNGGARPVPPGMLEASAARVRSEFAEQPELRAEILNTIGRVYLRTGQHERAQAILVEALAAGRAMPRPSLHLAQTLSDLGVLRRERGDYAGAQPLLEEALALRRRLRGPAHNDVAISLVELGRLHSATERIDPAETLFREALAIRRTVLGENRETATSLGDLATVLWLKGDLAAAAPLLEENVAMHRRTLGPEHPNLGQALANLGMLRFDQHDLPGAEARVREGLAMLRRGLTPRHWRIAGVLCSLGTVLRAQGRLEEASAALEEARRIAEESLSASHPLVAAVLVERAQVHLDQQEPARAEALLRRALAVQRTACPAGSWHTATTQSLLGAALLEQGQREEAQSLLEAARAVLPDVPGPRGRETAATRTRLALLSGRTTSTALSAAESPRLRAAAVAAGVPEPHR